MWKSDWVPIIDNPPSNWYSTTSGWGDKPTQDHPEPGFSTLTRLADAMAHDAMALVPAAGAPLNDPWRAQPRTRRRSWRGCRHGTMVDGRMRNPLPNARNPFDVHADVTRHYWWARGNHGDARSGDNYSDIPSELVNEGLGRSTPPPDPLAD